MVISAHCFFNSYGCFPTDNYNGNIYAPGNIPAPIICSDFSEPLLEVINLILKNK